MGKRETNGQTRPARQDGAKPQAAGVLHAQAPRLRILIIHQNFPGQFRHLALHLLTRSDVEVLGLGRDTAPGLKIDAGADNAQQEFPWFKYKLHRQVKAETHPYLRQMEAAVLHGQAVARALGELKNKGFTPDIILAHPGWGETLYAKQIFPQAKLIHFCEWYYSTHGADFNFDPEFPSMLDDHLRITTWNALHLLNLENCDAAIAPTHWQKNRFPAAYQHKIQVIHEGIDTHNLNPNPHAEIAVPSPRGEGGASASGEGKSPNNIQTSVEQPALPPSPRGRGAGGEGQASKQNAGLTLKSGDPIITYVARNLEPYRGFHTFMRALPQVLRQHPSAQIIIVGGDGRSYGAMPKDAKNWREAMLAELTRSPDAAERNPGQHAAQHNTASEPHQAPTGPLPEGWQTRIHFLGKVPYDTYKKILQVSAAHVYLTYPFVLSWSLLEAMATGCRIIASDTAPVREVIQHGKSGTLVPFFDTEALADSILASLAEPERFSALGLAAQAQARSFSLANGINGYLKLLGLSTPSMQEVAK